MIIGKMTTKKDKLIGIGVLLLVIGLFGIIYLIENKPIPKPTNEFEVWDYNVYGITEFEYMGSKVEIDKTKLYTESYCEVNLGLEEGITNFTITLSQDNETKLTPGYLDVLPINNESLSQFEWHSEPINKSTDFNYTCYGRFVGYIE